MKTQTNDGATAASRGLHAWKLANVARTRKPPAIAKQSKRDVRRHEIRQKRGTAITDARQSATLRQSSAGQRRIAQCNKKTVKARHGEQERPAPADADDADGRDPHGRRG